MEFTNWQTALIYLFAILVLVYGTFRYEKNKNVMYILFGALPILIVSSLRKNVGTDFVMYKIIFNRYSDIGFYEFLSSKNLEIGYFIINKVGNLFNSFSLTLLISSFLTLIIPIWTVKDEKNISLPIFTFFLMAPFFSSFNIIRQGIATSILFNAFYKYILTESIDRLIFKVFIAATFHTSAILMLPFALLNIIKSKTLKNIFTFLIFSTLVILFTRPTLLDLLLKNSKFLGRYTNYVTGKVQGNNYSFYLKLITFACLLVFKKRMNSLVDHSNYLYAMTFFNLLLTVFGFKMIFVKRIAEYFYLFSTVLVSLLPALFIEKDRFMIKIVLSLYSIAMFFLSFWYFGFSNIFPYRI